MRQFSYLGLFCSFFLIIFATMIFVPISLSPEEYTINFIPFFLLDNTNDVHIFDTEKISNILVFIPFGLFLPMVFTKYRACIKAIFISFWLIFSIEFIQYFTGRSADIDDVILNLLGSLLGYIIYWILSNLFKKEKWWNTLTNTHEKFQGK
ncbi:VanZ family protein [Clostridioides difficile]|nr:VanZ family protein [Clostridioides difficile]